MFLKRILTKLMIKQINAYTKRNNEKIFPSAKMPTLSIQDDDESGDSQFQLFFVNDEEITSFGADSRDIESKLLQRSILKSVCNKNVDKIMKKLFLIFLKEFNSYRGSFEN